MGLHEEKQELFIAMRKLKEPARSLAMQQATDKFSELGKVFIIKMVFLPQAVHENPVLYMRLKKRKISRCLFLLKKQQKP